MSALVLEAAKPWSRKTHKYFPVPARVRAIELLRVGQWFKRLPSDFPIPFEVFEVFVMPHAIVRSRGRELRRESAGLRAELQRRIEQLRALEDVVEVAGEEMPGAHAAAAALAAGIAEVKQAALH